MKKFTAILSVLIAIGAFIFVQKYSIEKRVIKDGDELLEPIIGDKDNPDAAYRFRYAMLAGKEHNIDLPQLRRDAISYTKQKKVQSTNLMKASAPYWSALGPGNIGGRVRSILINPTNSNVVLAGSVSGGIWKTTDAGATWKVKTDSLSILAINTMLIDPVNNNIVYAGTGEGWLNLDAVYGGGIYKSTNFGDSWNLLPSTIGASAANFRCVMKLAADPVGNIYAATKDIRGSYGPYNYTLAGGLFKSTNSGTSWTKISSTNFATNYFNPCDVIPVSSTIIIYAVGGNGLTLGGIYRTTDGGTNWGLIASRLPTSNYGRIAFAQDPNNANTVLAVFESWDTSPARDAGLKRIYKSTDAGATWNRLTSPPKIASTATTGNMSYFRNQGWYDNVIAIDPYNSNNIYVGGVDMMKSTNGGASWSHLTYWHPYYGTPVVHADHHAIVFDPNNTNTIFNGNDGGIYKTTDGGASWTNLNNGLEITQFYGGAVFKNGATYFGGTQDNGHLKYGGSGTTWSEVYGGDGGYAAQDQSSSSVSYEEYVYLAISKTTDGGSNWNNCVTGLSDANDNTKCLFIAPFAMNPENSAVLLAGSNSVWVTGNSAASWTRSSNVLSASGKVSAVAVVNTASNYLGFAGTTDGKIFKCASLNPASGVDTWTNVTPSGNNGGYVRRVVVDLNNKSKIFATYGGYNTSGTLTSRHVWYSTDQSSTWTDISGNLPNVPVHSLAIDPISSSTMYVGTETGVYSTTNGGGSWSSFNSGMPLFVPTDELVIQGDTKLLFAFTHGRGVWSSASSPLPVELSSFAVVSQRSNAELKWRTETESNNYGFEIERKTIPLHPPLQVGSDEADGGFEKIGFVPGAGTSNAPKEYSFTDMNISPGKYLYRLKQIDRDGSFKYSESLEATVSPAPSMFALDQNYPNPFNPFTTIRYGLPSRSIVRIIISNTVGQEIAVLENEEKEAGYHEVKWQANVASGIYFYGIDATSLNDPNNRFVQVKKMLLLK